MNCLPSGKTAVADVFGLYRVSPQDENGTNTKEVRTENSSQLHRAVGADPIPVRNSGAAGPLNQQEEKTGGWTTGREVGLQTFCDMSKDLWSATVRAIDAKIERTSWYPIFQQGLEDALPLLAGTNSFQLNRQPAHLEVRSFEVVSSDADGN